MKKTILFFTLILVFVILSGAGCAPFGGEERVTNTSEAPSANVNEEIPAGNVNASEDPTAGWEIYQDVPWAVYMKYPPKYKMVFDTYGWPHALVHFVEVAGAQSYRATIETWDRSDEFRATYGRDSAFIVEHPNGKNYVTVDYNPDPTNPAVAREWELILSTFRFVTSAP